MPEALGELGAPGVETSDTKFYVFLFCVLVPYDILRPSGKHATHHHCGLDSVLSRLEKEGDADIQREQHRAVRSGQRCRRGSKRGGAGRAQAAAGSQTDARQGN